MEQNKFYQIKNITEQEYTLVGCDDSVIMLPIQDVDNSASVFTIKDAKPGDVLYLLHEGKEHVIIYKGLVKNNFSTVLSAYCAYNGVVNDFCFADVSSYASITSERDEKEFYPATKEQRDFLFQKMREAGYEWDAEKKELKKIEPKPAENKGMNLVEEEMTPFQKKVFFIIDTAIEEEQGLKQVCDELLRLAHDEIMQNPAWSEEDEWKFSDILALLRGGENFHYNTPELFNWLKSLKDRLKGGGK